MSKAAWIKSTLAWKEGRPDPGNSWRTVNYLIASERIGGGRDLSDPGTYHELLAFLHHLRSTAPAQTRVIIAECNVIHQPTVRWCPIDSPYKAGDEVTGSHDLAPLTEKLWARLGGFLEECQFDYWEPSYYRLDGEDLTDEIMVQRTRDNA